MHEPDSEFLGFQNGVDLFLFSVNPDGSAVRLKKSSDDIEHRGFSGAVFSEESMNFTGFQLEVDVLQDLVCAKTFRDMF